MYCKIRFFQESGVHEYKSQKEPFLALNNILGAIKVFFRLLIKGLIFLFTVIHIFCRLVTRVTIIILIYER